MHIERVVDLRRLLTQPRGPLTLALEELGTAREDVERRIHSDYNACGCGAATIGLLGGLAVGLALTWLLAMAWWLQLVAVSLISVGASGFGKWIGRATARRRLKQTIADALSESLGRAIK